MEELKEALWDLGVFVGSILAGSAVAIAVVVIIANLASLYQA